MADDAPDFAAVEPAAGYETLAAFGAAVARLAALPEHEYERCRKAEAKELEVRIGVLDRAVKLARARAAGETDDMWEEMLKDMNERFAVVMIGGSTKVAKVDEYDPCLDRRYIRIMGVQDFKVAHMNVRIPAPTKSDPDRTIGCGEWWLLHGRRRQHLGGITLDASGELGDDYLNTWKGFAVTPCEGDPSVFLDHIRMITAGNGEEAYAYLVGWCASKVQRPGDQMEVAVVLRGDEGTGKGALGHTMRTLFGGHGLHISQGEHLVGKFNAHLADCCFLFADEAFFAGDRRHVNVLKALITEQTITVERKYVDAQQGRNRLGIMMASNNDFVVPAGKDARRFCCIDVPGTHKRDPGYFKAFFAATADTAKLGAFLHYLQHYDLSGFEIRNFPQTGMLTDQRISTFDQDEKWLLNRLGRAHFPDAGFDETKADGGGGWRSWLPTDHLFNDYEETLRANGRPQFALNIVHFGRFMGRYYRPRKHRGDTGYELGDLTAARDAFAKYHGLVGVDWGEGEELP